MNNSDKATPRPWKASGTDHNYNNLIQTKDFNEDFGTGSIIARISDFAPMEQKANAELIVKAVNSHDSLLEACKDAQSMIEAFIDNDIDNMNDAQKVIARLVSAINQAEGV